MRVALVKDILDNNLEPILLTCLRLQRTPIPISVGTIVINPSSSQERVGMYSIIS